MRYSAFVTLLFTALFTWDTVGSSCPNTFTPVSNKNYWGQTSCYFAFGGNRSYSEAKDLCESGGAHILFLASEDERIEILIGFPMWDKTTWLGLENISGVWMWVDGTSQEAVGTTNFRSGESGYDRAVADNLLTDDKWVSVSQSMKYKVLCEREHNITSQNSEIPQMETTTTTTADLITTLPQMETTITTADPITTLPQTAVTNATDKNKDSEGTPSFAAGMAIGAGSGLAAAGGLFLLVKGVKFLATGAKTMVTKVTPNNINPQNVENGVQPNKEARIGDNDNEGANQNKGQGEEDQGEEDQGEEDQGEEDQGEEDQGKEDRGGEDQGEEDQGEEDQGEEDQGEEYQGEEDQISIASFSLDTGNMKVIAMGIYTNYETVAFTVEDKWNIKQHTVGLKKVKPERNKPRVAADLHFTVPTSRKQNN